MFFISYYGRQKNGYSKVFLSQTPEPMNMAKKNKECEENDSPEPQNRKSILDCPG
jgi:hypothetical protein